MALARRSREGLNYWPGFVDALTTLLLGIIFLLTVFAVVQFYLSQEVTGKETALTRLNVQIAQLTDMLSLEKTGKASLEETIAQLRANLVGAEGDTPGRDVDERACLLLARERRLELERNGGLDPYPTLAALAPHDHPLGPGELHPRLLDALRPRIEIQLSVQVHVTAAQADALTVNARKVGLAANAAPVTAVESVIPDI